MAINQDDLPVYCRFRWSGSGAVNACYVFHRMSANDDVCAQLQSVARYASASLCIA